MRTILLLVGAISIYRNPFVFRESPQSARRKQAVVHAQIVVPVTTPAVETPPTMPPPQKPLFAWKYIGSFGPKADRFAVLAKDRELLNVRAGEAVEGNVVRAITTDFVDVIVDGETRRVLVGQ